MSDEGSPTSLLDHIVTTDGLDRNLVKAITSNTTSQASSPSNATTGQDGNTALASPSSPLAATKRTAGGYHMPSGAAVAALKNSSFTMGSPKPKAEEGARPRQRSIAFADAQGAEGTAPPAKSKGVRADSSEKVHRPPLSPQAKPAQQPTLGGEAQLAQSASGPGYFIDAEEADSEELDEVEGLGELAPMALKGKKGMIREGGGIPSFVGTARWHASPSKEKMKLLSGYFSETSSSGHGSALEDDEDSGLVGSKRRSRSNSGYGTVNGADPHHHQHHHSSSPSTKTSGGLFGWFGRTQSNTSAKGSHDGGGSPQVRTRRVVNAVFSKDGSLNVATTGVSIRKLLWSQEWYFAITGATWPQLLLGSFFMWLTVGICIASLYFAASAYCGARRSVVMAFYFNVVSLAANGGYLGEDPIMIDPVGHPKCFELRTLIVMIASYLNILCVGFIAAVMLAKAAAPASLKYRIVFSDLVVAREIYTAPDAVLASPALASPASDKKALNKRVPHGALVAKAFRQLTDREAPTPSKATEADNNSDPRRVTRVGSNSKDDSAKGLLSYLLQFRIGNVSQDADKAVLSGELHVFLVTMEIVDIRKRSVQSRCYELPWAALEEDHDDDEFEEEDGFANDEDGEEDDTEGMELDPATASQSGIFRHTLNGEGNKKSKSTGGRANSSRDASELYAYDFGTSKSLRLWFPVSASIAVSPDCSTRAIRLLYNLLIRHSRAGLRNKNLRYAHDANIENVFDFQIVTEYRAQDTKTGGSSFVARYAYAPSDILRKFRFSDTCAYLSSITYQNIVNTYGIEAGGSSSPKMPHSITAAAASLLPSIEVDFSQFNVVEPDV